VNARPRPVTSVKSSARIRASCRRRFLDGGLGIRCRARDGFSRGDGARIVVGIKCSDEQQQRVRPDEAGARRFGGGGFSARTLARATDSVMSEFCPIGSGAVDLSTRAGVNATRPATHRRRSVRSVRAFSITLLRFVNLQRQIRRCGKVTYAVPPLAAANTRMGNNHSFSGAGPARKSTTPVPASAAIRRRARPWRDRNPARPRALDA